MTTASSGARATVSETESHDEVIDDKLVYAPAVDLDTVIHAWRLVYQAYTRIDLIVPNPYELHTVDQAPASGSIVINGSFDDRIVSTLTIITDGSAGLPLDEVYPDVLRRMRRGDRPIIEIGLLADRRESFSRSIDAIFEMMRFVYWHAQLRDARILCGVHPRHVAFYKRMFGFDIAAETSVCPRVNHSPVVMLHLDIPDRLQWARVPKGLARYERQPLGEDDFTPRCAFTPNEVAESVIARYLRRHGADARRSTKGASAA